LKKYFYLVILLMNSITFAQFDISAGMGLNFFSAPDLQNYINSNYSSTGEMSSFNTSADFFGEVGYNINESYQISIDYTYNIYSFNSNFVSGIYDLQLTQHKPSLIGYYVIGGVGYKIKIGGGAGLRIAKADEKLPGLTQVGEYSKTGFGFLLKAQGDTKLGGNLYALIAGEIRYEVLGDIEVYRENTFNLNSFGVVLKLGMVYYF